MEIIAKDTITEFNSKFVVNFHGVLERGFTSDRIYRFLSPSIRLFKLYFFNSLMKIQNIPDDFVQTFLQVNRIEKIKTKIKNKQIFIDDIR